MMQKSPPYASRSNFYYLFAYKPWKLESPIALHNHSHSPIQSNKRFKTQRMIFDLNHASIINVSPRKKFRAIRQSNHNFSKTLNSEPKILSIASPRQLPRT